MPHRSMTGCAPSAGPVPEPPRTAPRTALAPPRSMLPVDDKRVRRERLHPQRLRLAETQLLLYLSSLR